MVRVLRDQGRLAEAEARARDHLRRVRSIAPAGHIWLAEPLENLGWILIRLGKYEQAEPVLREALTLRGQYGPPGPGGRPGLAEDQFGNRVLLGLALAGQKKYAEAGPLLETGYRGVREFGWARSAVPPPVLLSEAAARLAEMYKAAGDPGGGGPVARRKPARASPATAGGEAVTRAACAGTIPKRSRIGDRRHWPVKKGSGSAWEPAAASGRPSPPSRAFHQPGQMTAYTTSLAVFRDSDVPRDSFHPATDMANCPIAAEPSSTLQELQSDHLREFFCVVGIASRPLAGGGANVREIR